MYGPAGLLAGAFLDKIKSELKSSFIKPKKVCSNCGHSWKVKRENLLTITETFDTETLIGVGKGYDLSMICSDGKCDCDLNQSDSSIPTSNL